MVRTALLILAATLLGAAPSRAVDFPEAYIHHSGDPENRVNIITDATAIVDKFANLECAVTIARSDLDPKVADFKINVIDTLRVNAAFRGIPYPFSPGDPCP